MADQPQGQSPRDRAIMEAILGLLRAVAPAVASNEDVAASFAAAERQEHGQLNDIYDSLLNPEKVDECRTWALILIRQNEQGEEERTVFPAPKRLEEATDMNEVAIWLAAFGLLVAPSVRAALMTHGYRFTWANAKAKPKKTPPLIILPGGRED